LPGEVDEFKANLSKRLKALLERESEKVKRYEKVSFWCEDESRFGCHTIARNKITLFGVKPIGNFQYNFQCFWLYGAVEPRQGRSFFYEFSHLDGDCFGEYLLQLSLTPQQRVWLYLKNFLAWETFESLDALRDKLDALLNRLSNDTIGYLTGWSWILEALCLSGI